MTTGHTTRPAETVVQTCKNGVGPTCFPTTVSTVAYMSMALMMPSPHSSSHANTDLINTAVQGQSEPKDSTPSTHR